MHAINEVTLFRMLAIAYLAMPYILGFWMDCVGPSLCIWHGKFYIYGFFPNTILVLLLILMTVSWFDSWFWGLLFLSIVPWTLLFFWALT